jgi:acyl-CoA thioesterase-2
MDENMLEQLIKVLTPEPDGSDRFIGENMHPEGFRVYGGQVLGQAVSAAVATVEEGRSIHSQHAYFLRPGDVKLPIVYEVERARDGGSFSSRRVVAQQNGKPILVSSMSFQQASLGDEYQPTPPQVPPPESLRSDRQLALEEGGHDPFFQITTGEDLDVRQVDPIDYNQPVPREPAMQVWMKTTGRLPDRPGLHQALLAYMSDTYLIDVCLLPAGRFYKDSSMQVASLDHALWFHCDCRVDEWLLHVLEADQVGGGRGLGRGHFFTREGQLVATVMQQGLMRYR